MFQEMRRNDRGLGRAEAEAILAKGLYGVLSLKGDDYPYGVPLSYVYTDGCLYFHCALQGKKLRLLRQDDKAAFCVVDEAVPLADARSMRYESAMVFGRVSEVKGEAEKLAALLAFVDRYTSGEAYTAAGRDQAVNMLAKTAVLKLTVEHITGKARR
jgi:nitroimidazol reductase NimA-like FMN-containing flavoprotein (pyridoxamine 5'-phosphate oxidase superfamily)